MSIQSKLSQFTQLVTGLEGNNKRISKNNKLDKNVNNYLNGFHALFHESNQLNKSLSLLDKIQGLRIIINENSLALKRDLINLKDNNNATEASLYGHALELLNNDLEALKKSESDGIIRKLFSKIWSKKPNEENNKIISEIEKLQSTIKSNINSINENFTTKVKMDNFKAKLENNPDFKKELVIFEKGQKNLLSRLDNPDFLTACLNDPKLSKQNKDTETLLFHIHNHPDFKTIISETKKNIVLGKNPIMEIDDAMKKVMAKGILPPGRIYKGEILELRIVILANLHGESSLSSLIFSYFKASQAYQEEINNPNKAAYDLASLEMSIAYIQKFQEPTPNTQKFQQLSKETQEHITEIAPQGYNRKIAQLQAHFEAGCKKFKNFIDPDRITDIRPKTIHKSTQFQEFINEAKESLKKGDNSSDVFNEVKEKWIRYTNKPRPENGSKEMNDLEFVIAANLVNQEHANFKRIQAHPLFDEMIKAANNDIKNGHDPFDIIMASHKQLCQDFTYGDTPNLDVQKDVMLAILANLNLEYKNYLTLHAKAKVYSDHMEEPGRFRDQEIIQFRVFQEQKAFLEKYAS